MLDELVGHYTAKFFRIWLRKLNLPDHPFLTLFDRLRSYVGRKEILGLLGTLHDAGQELVLEPCSTA